MRGVKDGLELVAVRLRWSRGECWDDSRLRLPASRRFLQFLPVSLRNVKQDSWLMLLPVVLPAVIHSLAALDMHVGRYDCAIGDGARSVRTEQVRWACA